jgi:hypothetical protein
MYKYSSLVGSRVPNPIDDKYCTPRELWAWQLKPGNEDIALAYAHCMHNGLGTKAFIPFNVPCFTRYP